MVWPASDGHVTIAFLFWVSLGPFTRRLMEWVHEEGFCDEATKDKDWIEYAMLLHEGVESVEEYARVRGIVERFTSSKTKAELLEGAVARKLLVAPVRCPGSFVVSDRQQVGPPMTKFLADFGATVVKVESSSLLDVTRTVGPFTDNEPGSDRSAIFNTVNAGKMSIALALSKPEGIEVVEDLVHWADVMTEAFAPGVMDRLGLGDDRLPAGPFSVYTDYVTPRFGLGLILAALDHRRRGGGGQIFDFSQVQGASHFLTPTLLEYFVNGRSTVRAGSDDVIYTPHGVYPSAGDENWTRSSAHGQWCVTTPMWLTS
jgi:crotonobetainyl-CoA:carnitine CoA-transferase CaiB-like acyl-CoA transferase